VGTTTQTFTGDASNLEKAYQSLAKEVARLESANQKLAGQMAAQSEGVARGMKSQENAIGSALNSVKGYATGFLSVGAAVGLVNKALEEQRRLSKDIADTNTEAGKSQGDVLTNLVGVDPAEQRRILAEVNKIQRDTGFGSIDELNRGAASAISASGGDVAGALDALRESARLSVLKPEQLKTVAGGALDVRAATGIQDQRQNLGLLLSFQSAARGTDLERVARNAAPSISSMAKSVPTDQKEAARQSAALLAALSQGAKDFTLESTATAGIQLADHMTEFFTKGIAKEANGRKYTVRPQQDPQTIEGRVEFLQQNERFRKLFIENFVDKGMETKFREPTRGLLDSKKADNLRGQGVEPVADLFKKFQGSIQYQPQAVDELAKQLREATPQTQIAAGDAARKSAGQQIDLSSPGGAARMTADEVTSSIRDKIISPRRGVLDSMAEGFWNNVELMAGSSPTEVARKTVGVAEGMAQTPQEFELIRRARESLATAEFENRRPVEDLRRVRQSPTLGERFTGDFPEASFRAVRERVQAAPGLTEENRAIAISESKQIVEMLRSFSGQGAPATKRSEELLERVVKSLESIDAKSNARATPVASPAAAERGRHGER